MGYKENIKAVIAANVFTNHNNLVTAAGTKSAMNYIVDGLGAKIDAMQGVFYGFFATAADLPSGETEVGYAYVGASNPYTIYNYDGNTWTSSGVTYDAPVGNGEDIDTNASGQLQFANRPDTNGMGYKILRTDATFASQVTDSDTIYEIRYDFDLAGGSVTIPSGCVLRFNGGSIGNGTIEGTLTKIESADVEIFSGISFDGTFIGDLNACWVGAKPGNSGVDCSLVLQDWFDDYCDVFANISFPRGSYYFKTATELSTDKRRKHIIGNNSIFYVNIPTDDAVFITLQVCEEFSLRDVTIVNQRQTNGYDISRTNAIRLNQTQMFAFQGVRVQNFDRAFWFTDVWYGGFYGKNISWQNRVAIYIDTLVSSEVNTIDIDNVRVSGCSLDAAQAIYPQATGESNDDYAMRVARCGVDVHCSTYSVKYNGMVIEGVDYGIRYNYRAFASFQATIDAMIPIINCYFEGITTMAIYIGSGYVVNPNNYAYTMAITGGVVLIESCSFHSNPDTIYIKDCRVSVFRCQSVNLLLDSVYNRTEAEVDEWVNVQPMSGEIVVTTKGTKLQYPSNSGNIYPNTLRQFVGNLRSANMESMGVQGSGSLAIDNTIYRSNGTAIPRFIPLVNCAFDAPRSVFHTGIKPYEMSIVDNQYRVKIRSGNGYVDVSCWNNRLTACLFSLRNDGIEITEFIRRWKAGTAYTGYVNQVFPYKVRSVPSEGKLYMEDYQGNESLFGIGKKAIDDGFSFSTANYFFVEALCLLFHAYSSPRFMADFVQCGRNYSEFGDTGSSTAQYNKFRMVGTETQRDAIRPRFNAIFYNTTAKKLQIFDGFNWVELTDTFKRYIYAESGKSIAERAVVPDIPGQTFMNYATGIKYTYILTSPDKYSGEWVGDIGAISSLTNPNGYDAGTNPVDYTTELQAGEMVRYNGNIVKWDGSGFVNLDGTPVS